MDIKKLTQKLPAKLQKLLPALLVLLIGVILLSSPGKKSENATLPADETVQEVSTEEKLERILSTIEGVGTVRVMLTVATGTEYLYQTDQNISGSDNANSTQLSTVTVTDAQRNQSGLLKQENPPQYLGAIIVCSGAERAGIRLAVVEAVSKATGLGADHISVLKMK